MNSAQTFERKPDQEFKEGVHKVGKDLSEVKSNLSDLAHDAASTARAGMQEVSQGVRRTYDAGKERTVHAAERFSDSVAENPFTSIGIAVGAGFLLGFLMRGSRD